MLRYIMWATPILNCLIKMLIDFVCRMMLVWNATAWQHRDMRLAPGAEKEVSDNLSNDPLTAAPSMKVCIPRTFT